MWHRRENPTEFESYIEIRSSRILKFYNFIKFFSLFFYSIRLLGNEEDYDRRNKTQIAVHDMCVPQYFIDLWTKHYIGT